MRLRRRIWHGVEKFLFKLQGKIKRERGVLTVVGTEGKKREYGTLCVVNNLSIGLESRPHKT